MFSWMQVCETLARWQDKAKEPGGSLQVDLDLLKVEMGKGTMELHKILLKTAFLNKRLVSFGIQVIGVLTSSSPTPSRPPLPSAESTQTLCTHRSPLFDTPSAEGTNVSWAVN